jgi:DNA repair protein RadC
MKYHIKEVKLQRLRECQVDNPLLESADKVDVFCRENIINSENFNSDVENFYVLMVNVRKRIKSFVYVSSGTLDTLLVHPREVFKIAIVQNAAAIILMHNHPSGDPSPSEADIKITRDLIRAGQLLKIDVLDHIVMGEKTETNKGYASVREMGYFNM